MAKEAFRYSVGLSVAILLTNAAAEDAEQQADAAPGVAVYCPELDGGASCGETGILDALKKMDDLAASAITDLSPDSLAKCRVLIVPDVYQLGKGGQDWNEAVPKFGRDGGGVLYSFHCPAMPPESVFPEIVKGFRRHFPRKLSAVIPHPITFMVVPFETSYADHRDLTPGGRAQVLLKCAEGEPIAVAGSVGKGRVFVSGIVLGFGPGSEKEPEGDELRLLRQSVLWLAHKHNFVEQEAKDRILRGVVSASWRQPEQLPIVVSAFVPDSMRKGAATATIELKDPAGKAIASETVQIDLSHEPEFDDFNYYMGYFTPEFVERMTKAGRAKSDSLIFTPLLYYPGLTEEFFREYGPFVDGVIFHFRADSGPASYIQGYDPSSFQDYAECMRTEMRQVRKLAGTEPVICGFYIWYTRGGWGVHYREGTRRFAESDIRAGKVPGPILETHTAMDALLKVCLAHEYADAMRVYGLGIRHPAYRAMGAMIRDWQEREIPWGLRAENGK